MDYRFLGNTGVAVSQLAFGTMSFGGDADEATSRALFTRCRDAGINLFDTADVYNGGRSEEILGELVRDSRDEIVIATKAYFPTGEDVNARGASRLHLRVALEASLRRLQTDRVDLYYVHRFDSAAALGETLRALDDFVTAGKVLYLGASNFAAWQVQQALGLSALHGWAGFAAIQPMYNLVKRQAEVEILPQAVDAGLGVFPYSPLGGGLLTGKYGEFGARVSAGAGAGTHLVDESDAAASSRLVRSAAYAERYRDERAHATAAAFASFARAHGWEPAALAVAWVGAHPAVTAPLIGARSVAQLEGSLAALSIPMTRELRDEIAALSVAPPPATDRSEEGTGAGMWAR